MSSYTGTLIVPYRFVTIFIITHGEDLMETTIESVFNADIVKNNHYKLTVSGLTGNVTTGSDTVDAIYSQIPRILAHDRTMSPLQKLKEVHKKMHSGFNFKDEVKAQSKGQLEFIDERPNEYQRTVRNENWFPEPTFITYDRAYYFTANPIKWGDKSRDAMERNEFGVWLLDASLDIATKLELRPGCESDPLSLLNMLGINLSSEKRHNSSDESGATKTSLFIIMAQLMSLFGDDIHINVIDVTCRYCNWDRYKPNAKPKHKIGKAIQNVAKWMTHVSPVLGATLLRVGDRVNDEVPSAAATETANEYNPESVVLVDGQSFPVEKWYHDGNIKLSTFLFPNVWKLEDGSPVVVTSTELLSTHYNLVKYSIGPHHQLIDTTTLFKDNDQDRIVNGNSLETTHDIEVFYVLRNSPKIIVTLKRKPAMRGIESWLPGDHDTDINAYLTLFRLEPSTGIRQWTIDPQSELFFKQVYDTVVRVEARRPKRHLTDANPQPLKKQRPTAGGRKKQKKRRTRRLRVKTNKSNKTRFRYSTSYRKTQ